MEYLASVVEFDAWDKLDKDWTSNVALRNMTPENVRVLVHTMSPEHRKAPAVEIVFVLGWGSLFGLQNGR